MKPHFFRTTHDAHVQITELFNVVWPTVAAMHNLRTQALDYIQTNPNANDIELDEHFAYPANIRSASLKSSWLGQTWESQQEGFAKMLLINIVSIYEGWIRNVLKDLQLKESALEKFFEYSEATSQGTAGIESVLTLTIAEESYVLKRCFYNQLCSHEMYAPLHLGAMLACYRYFKEIRNCELHHGGKATRRLVRAYSYFASVATFEQLGCCVVPKHYIPVLGQKTRIDIHGVAALASIVLRIMVTLDAELSRSKRAEMAFVRKWRAIHSRTVRLPNDQRQRERYLKQLFGEAAFPVCDESEPMLLILQQFALGYVPVISTFSCRPHKLLNEGINECPDGNQTKMPVFVK